MSLFRIHERPSPPLLYPALLLVLSIPTYLLVFNGDLDLNGDNARHYIFGTSLSQGAGYTNIHTLERTPVSTVPPGYPAIIALSMMAGFSEYVEVKIVNGILFGLSVLLIFGLSRILIRNPHLAFVISVLSLFNGHLLRYASMMMSEIPFLLVSLIALYAATRIGSTKRPWKDPFVVLFLLSTVAGYYVRAIGLALLVAAIAWHLYRRQWMLIAAHAAAWLLLVGPWTLRGRSVARTGYLDMWMQADPYAPGAGTLDIANLFWRVVDNAERYLTTEIQHALFNFSLSSLDGFAWLMSPFIVVVSVLGALTLARYRVLIIAYLAATFAVLLSWPGQWFGPRFLVPVIPLLFLLFVNGLHHLLSRVWQRVAPGSTVQPLFLLLLLA